MIWNYDLEEIKNGYYEKDEAYYCIQCDAHFEKGRIYHIGDHFYDAKSATKQHIILQHEDMATHLLTQGVGVTGLSEIQKNLITLLLEGKSDKEIGNALGIAQSTVRNHRFKLREKEKQAKIFLSLMSLLTEKSNTSISKTDDGALDELHSSATMIDDRYSITEKEREKTISTYMDSTGKLLQIPAREKKKLIILREITKHFKVDATYTENEIDRILKRIYEEDYVGIRRALIEYGFMDRTSDGSVYRVKEA
jgi:DNA-binding CsgD family transcriptional regulator